jgi:RNA polymerase sigma factor (sigma-70 family)
MRPTPLERVVLYLREVCAGQEARLQPDAELLKRFVDQKSDAAFAALVHRHGPMVFSVCLRIFGNAQDAEDGFQATFLVLARRAASIKRNKPLGNWLYGVAQRVALKARAKAALRQEREREAATMPRPEPFDELSWKELRGVLDEEVGRLPERYRAPIVLCYFEGVSQSEAAMQIGCPRTSLVSRLGRAEDLLRERLVRRGITLSAGALTAALTQQATGTAMGAMLVINTVKAAMSPAAAKAAGCISARAIAWAEEVMTGILGTKTKLVVLLVALGLGVGGASVAGMSGWSEKPGPGRGDDIPAPVSKSAPVQDKQEVGEKLYRAMEKKILEAKSLRVTFDLSVTKDGKEGIRIKGTVQLGTDNKLRIDAEGAIEGKQERIKAVCDGRQLVYRDTDHPALLPVQAPAALGSAIRGLMARVGAIGTILGSNTSSSPPSGDIGKLFTVSNFEFAGTEKIGKTEARIVRCTLTMPGNVELEEKIWIDPATSLPVKREIVENKEFPDATDVYTEFVIDPKLDAKLFELSSPLKADEASETKTSSPEKAKTDVPLRLDLFGDALPMKSLVRLGTVRYRPGTEPSYLHFLQGGKVIGVGYGGGMGGLLFYDVDSGRLVRKLDTVAGGVISADGKLLFNTQLEVHDVETGHQLRGLRMSGFIGPGFIAIAPNGKTVAASEDRIGMVSGKIYVWDVATGKELHRLEGHTGTVSSIAFSPDSKTVVSGGEDKTIRLWDVASGKELGRLKAHEGYIACVTVSPNGKLLDSIAEDGVIHLWDIDSGKSLSKLQSDQGAVRRISQFPDTKACVVFSPDGKLLCSVGAGGTICLWESETGKRLQRWTAHADNIQSVAFSPDGNTLASVGEADHAIRLWDTRTGKLRNPVTGHTGRIDGLRFTDDGKSLLSRAKDNAVLQWDLATSLPQRPLLDGLVLAREQGQMELLDFASQRMTTALVAIAPKDKTNAVTINLWDASAGKLLHSLKGNSAFATIPKGFVKGTFSSDEKLLVTIGMDGARIWDTGTGRQLHFEPGTILSSAFSPDSKLLALGTAETVHFWNAVTRASGKAWETGMQADHLAFAPDGRSLAALDFLGAVRIWAADTGKELLRFGAPDPKRQLFFTPQVLAFSPSGRVLATAGRACDQREPARVEGRGDLLAAVFLWDAWTGEEITQIVGPQRTVTALAFSPDGRTLATGGDDSTILLWDLSSQTHDEKAQPTALTAAELEAQWTDLGKGGASADRAIWTLARAGKQSVPMLKERLQRVATGDANSIAGLIADLDSRQFAVRQKAMQTLGEMGDAAEAALRKFVTGNPALEVRQRVEQILDKRDKDPEMFRSLRAIEALENIGSAESRAALETLVKEAANPRIAEAASAALKRESK